MTVRKSNHVEFNSKGQQAMTQISGTITFFVFMYFMTSIYANAQEYDYQRPYPVPAQEVPAYSPGVQENTSQMQRQYDYQNQQMNQSQSRCAAGYGCY